MKWIKHKFFLFLKWFKRNFMGILDYTFKEKLEKLKPIRDRYIKNLTSTCELSGKQDLFESYSAEIEIIRNEGNEIELRCLEKRFLLVHEINLATSFIKIITYKIERDYNNYPANKLVKIDELRCILDIKGFKIGGKNQLTGSFGMHYCKALLAYINSEYEADSDEVFL